MSMWRRALICAFVLAPWHGGIAVAGPEECREAAAKYESAVADVRAALRAYAHCISNSEGHDDCSTEFATLQSAHDDFESAVSAYESDCR